MLLTQPPTLIALAQTNYRRSQLIRQLQQSSTVQKIRVIYFKARQSTEQIEKLLQQLSERSTRKQCLNYLTTHMLARHQIVYVASLLGTPLAGELAFLIYHNGDRTFIVNGSIVRQSYRQFWGIGSTRIEAISNLFKLSEQLTAKIALQQ